MQLSPAQRIDWLRLVRSENVGPRTFQAVLNHCGSASAALKALPDLARRGGAGRAVRICAREDAEQELAAATRMGVAFPALGDAPLLAVRGRVAALQEPICYRRLAQCLGGRDQVCRAARPRPRGRGSRGSVRACPRY